jgi:hypothetical protein
METVVGKLIDVHAAPLSGRVPEAGRNVVESEAVGAACELEDDPPRSACCRYVNLEAAGQACAGGVCLVAAKALSGGHSLALQARPRFLQGRSGDRQPLDVCREQHVIEDGRGVTPPLLPPGYASALVVRRLGGAVEPFELVHVARTGGHASVATVNVAHRFSVRLGW